MKDSMLTSKIYDDLYCRFLKSDPPSIAILDTTSRAVECHQWLSSIGFGEKMHVFIEDVHTDKNILSDMPVKPIQYLKEHSEITVIISERNVSEINELLKVEGITNERFFLYSVLPYLETNNKIYDEAEIRKKYIKNDEETNLFLDCYFLARSKGWNLILPMNYAFITKGFSKKYWHRQANELNCHENITLLDCGAFTGDTLEALYEQYGAKIRRAYELEADKTKKSAIMETIKRLNLTKIAFPFMLGVSDTADRFNLENAGTSSAKISSQGESSAETVRIDDLDLSVLGKLCIKMDIEGMEANALNGAYQTICRYKPELAICLYHQAADIFEIPEFVQNLIPEYKCIIRGGVHTVCYLSTERFNDK